MSKKISDYDALREMLDRAKVPYSTDGKTGTITIEPSGCFFKFRPDMSPDDVYGGDYEEF